VTGARLLSVNVGRPQTVTWRGQPVETSIWKAPAPGRVVVRRLNVDGDAQADLVGHGGEHRAVFVYQVESYRHWEQELDRELPAMGTFGENFTVTGLSDDEVCIGDRLAIGTAVFEVTQPRVTCYKVGLRLDEPRMPALLTGHGRPGFYLRVLQEGEVGAGDTIVKVAEGPQRLSVQQISALLYSGEHDPGTLRRALAIPALPEGWRGSFSSLLEQVEAGRAGNSGLTGAPADAPSWSGFRPFRVAAVTPETASVRSFTFEPADGAPLAAHRPGQFVAVRAPLDGGLVRSYSLSAPGDGRRLQISVKRDGRVSTFLHDRLAVGATLELAAPRGTFVLDGTVRTPVAFISAGIGVTPVLAMLASIVPSAVDRPVVWVHVARSSADQAFATQARSLLERLPAARAHVRFTQPGPDDLLGRDFDGAGRLTAADLRALKLPGDAEVFLCGPSAFMDSARADLAGLGLAADRIHTEAFGATRPANAAAPHPPEGEPQSGAEVSFARSGLTVAFGARWSSLLELAEACDVPADWSCRTGVCHRCESGLVSGEVGYDPEPLDRPAAGYTLLCCARPAGAVTLDL
jgi:ferredoxin-NADP reductase/MOSC domain-containing protein YiiM